MSGQNQQGARNKNRSLPKEDEVPKLVAHSNQPKVPDVSTESVDTIEGEGGDDPEFHDHDQSSDAREAVAGAARSAQPHEEPTHDEGVADDDLHGEIHAANIQATPRGYREAVQVAHQAERQAMH